MGLFTLYLHFLPTHPCLISSRYSVACQLVCDINKRFIAVHAGPPGSCHDSSVFRKMAIMQAPHQYFNQGQFLLADSAYGSSIFVVPAYKGKQALKRECANFNFCHAQSCVWIEHAIGILKGRWSWLREVRNQMRGKNEAQRLSQWIIVCAMLHNILAKLGDQWEELFVETDLEFLDDFVDTTTSTAQPGAMREHILPYTLQYHFDKYGNCNFQLYSSFKFTGM